jgi:hypothetical protein
VTPPIGKGLRAYLDAAKEPDSLFGDIQKHVLMKASLPNGRSLAHIHPSETVKDDWCIRANYFRIVTNVAHNPSQPTFRRENIFEEGNRTHSKWQDWLTEMGKLEGDFRCLRCDYVFYANAPVGCPACHMEGLLRYEELRLEYKPLMIQGRTDGYVPDENCLIEVKTMGYGGLKWEQPEFVAEYSKYSGGRSWVALDNLWRDFKRPMKTARRQGQLYLWLARKQGLDVDKILFIYDFKATQDCKSFLIKYDPSVVEDILDKCQEITDAVAAKVAPVCNNRGAQFCSQCQPYETGQP